MKEMNESYMYDTITLPRVSSFPAQSSASHAIRGSARGYRTKKRPSTSYYVIKRAFDFTLAFILSVLLALPIGILLLINMVPTKGHPVYFDHRVGMNGDEIRILKIRSMYIDANDHPEKYLSEEQMKQFLSERKVDNDPRITKFGRLIRKTSMDELPQIFNILLGSMSFVGPRPISQMEYETNFSPAQRRLLVAAKPGLLGNWAVHGRSNVTFESGVRQQMELDYVRNRSVWNDVKIMFAAVPAVLHSKGAK